MVKADDGIPRTRSPVRRRKTKKRSGSDVLAQPLQPQEVEAAVAVPRTAVSAAAPVPHDDGRHVTRDYSYVRAEIWRIAAVGGFITISLILTAIFLR